MKNFKSLLLAFVAVIFMFTSCEDSYDDTQIQDESQATIEALEALGLQFNADGTLNTTANPTGNIIFDYCFEFVYPLTLNYNNGTEVIVNNLDELGNVIINSTQTLYISNIQYPFDVETQDLTTNGTITQTIHTEAEFMALVAFCEFGIEDCLVTADIAPVCVSYTNASGDVETIQFQNMSYASCDGFTSADVVPCDNDDCEISNLEVIVGGCNFNDTYSITINFDTVNAYNEYFDVFAFDNTLIGTFEIANLPITIYNFTASGNSFDYITVSINGYTDCNEAIDWLAPTCIASCWDFVYPIEIYINGSTTTTTVSDDASFDTIYNNPANQIEIVYPVNIIVNGTTHIVTHADDLYNTYGWFDNRCD